MPRPHNSRRDQVAFRSALIPRALTGQTVDH